MNSTIKNRTLGATALLTILLGSAACGTETVIEPGTQPGYEARVYPPTDVPSAPVGEKKGHVSADSAEQKAAAEKAQQDQAAIGPWKHGTQVENKLKGGRP